MIERIPLATGRLSYYLTDRGGNIFDRYEGSNLVVDVSSDILASLLGGGQTTMTYSTLTSNFVLGETITGGTSGRTAVVVNDLDGDTLIIRNVSGPFTPTETITGATASATLDTYVAAGAGSTMNFVDTLAVGTDNTAADRADTSLTNPEYFPFSGVAYPSTGVVVFSFLIDYAEANNLGGAALPIYEFGLFTDETVDAEKRLFSRIVKPAINKDNSFSITGTWTLNFVRA